MGSLAHPLTFRGRADKPPRQALIVLENPEIGAAVAELLCELDFVPWTAADAATALALSAEIAFDLTLTDIALAGQMDGLDLAQELRRQFADMGIILLVDPLNSSRTHIEGFITFRKPKPISGARYDSIRYRFQ